MLFTVRSLSEKSLPKDHLRMDKKTAAAYDSCALGEQALYLSMSYIPLSQIRRVYKRLAVSKGFYEKDAIFGTLCYLVVNYDDHREKVIRFDKEEELNALLDVFRSRTDIPVGKPAEEKEIVA